MGADKSVLFTPTGATLDHGLAYSFGVLVDIAYWEDVDKPRTWAQWFGFDSWANVQTPGCVVPDFTYCKSPGRVVLAIPGSESWSQIFQFLVYSAQVPFSEITNARVHSFVDYCARQLLPHIEAVLADQPAATQIAICGHSLGGAIAQLIAWHLDTQGFVIRNTFCYNTPKVGDWRFARAIKAGGYCHVANTYDKVKEFPFKYFLEAHTAGSAVLWHINGWEHVRGMHLVNIGEDLAAGITAVGTTASSALVTAAGSGGPVVPWPATTASATEAISVAAMDALFAAGTCIVGAIGILGLNIENHKLRPLVDGIYDDPAWTDVNFDVIGVRQASVEAYRGANWTQQQVTFWDNLPQSARVTLATTPTPIPANAPIPASSVGTRADFLIALALMVGGTSGERPISNVSASLPLMPDGSASPVSLGGNRNFWLFRGEDRDMLLTLKSCLHAIDLRDYRVDNPAPAKGLSNREYIIDPEDFDQIDALYALIDHVDGLLSLVRS